MKITMTLTLPVDNVIQFFDVCAAGADTLRALGQQALDAGDHDQFRRTTHGVTVGEEDELPELCGQIKVSA